MRSLFNLWHKLPRVRYSQRGSSRRSISSAKFDDDENSAFLDGARAPQKERSNAGMSSTTLTLLNAIFFVVSLVLFSTWFFETHFRLNPKLRQASSYSPIHDLLDLNPQVKAVNGTLFPAREQPSIARQSPNPEAEAVWEEWELTRVLPVTAAQIRSMGKDPSTVAKLEDAIWGLGDDAYASTLDVYHQLHCLNYLRKLIYPDHYNRSEFHHADHPGYFEIHMNHCVDILMQAIQCSGNVNLIMMNWVETQDYPFPDMSINRQCVDFEKLTQWRQESTIDMDKYVRVMMKPVGVKEMKQSEEYFAFFEPNETSHGHTHGG